MDNCGKEEGGLQQGKSLVIVFSYHHHNTEKIAHAVARVLGAPVRTPQQVSPDDVVECDLVGFGSGIYSAKHHPSLLDLAGRLPDAAGRKAFIFSTYGAPESLFPGARLNEFILQNHAPLRAVLQSRGYAITGEFACAGWNTNSFLKYFGGLNKGRPGAEDIRNAETFAGNLKRSCGQTADSMLTGRN